MLMGIINLFFIPMISVFVFYKITSRNLKFSFEFIFIYSITAVAVAVISKTLFSVIELLFSLADIPDTSLYYSFTALAVALITPFIMKNVKFTCRGNEKQK